MSTSNFLLVGNHDMREDSPSQILDMSIDDILRLGLVSPFEDIEDDDLFGDDAVDDETLSRDKYQPEQRDSSLSQVETSQRVSNNDEEDNKNVSANDEQDDELVSLNEDQHQYATRAEVQHLSEYLKELRHIFNDRFDYLFQRDTVQRHQLKEHENLLTAQQKETEQVKKVLADHQRLINQQADLIAKQAEQIRQLEKRLSVSG